MILKDRYLLFQEENKIPDMLDIIKNMNGKKNKTDKPHSLNKEKSA